MPIPMYRPNTHASPTDPASTQNSRSPHSQTGNAKRSGEFATVISAQSDRYTHTVRTERGRTLTGLQRLSSSVGDISILPTGTDVLISYDYGTPLILGVLNMPSTANEESGGFQTTDTTDTRGQDSVSTVDTVGNYRRPHEPRDLIPGDWVRMAPDGGNMLGVMRGGTNVMRSSPLAQIRTHLIDDLVDIFSRNFRHVTDMGEFTIQNNEGRVNMRFRGASDQLTEAGSDEEKWTIKMDLGSEGDLFNFELCTPQGQTLFKFHVDSEGGVELYGVNGVAINSGSRAGGDHHQEHTGNANRDIGVNQVTTVGANDELITGGDKTSSIGGNMTTSVGNDYQVVALKDIGLSAGGKVYIAAQGGDNGAMTVETAIGDTELNLGTLGTGGLKVSTLSGDVKFSALTSGDFSWTSPNGNFKTNCRTAKLITQGPNSCVLGGDTLTSNLVKFQQLESLMRLLFIKLDQHQHVHTGTAVAAGMFSVTGFSGPPVIPIGSPLVGQLQTFKSTVAGVSS